MNQEQLEALLRQFAPNQQPERLEFTESVETVEVERPGPFAGAEPIKVKQPVRVLTWIDRGTGQVLRVQANTDGTYVKTFQGTEPKTQGEPSVPLPTAAQQQPQIVPTNTTEPHIVIRQPDGTLSTQPNPNYKGEPPKPGTNLHITSGGKHYLVPIDSTGKAGSAVELTGIAADVKPGAQSLVDGGDGKKYIVTINPDKTVTTTDTVGNPVPGGVPPKRDAGTIRYNPETGEYEQVRTDPSTGKATVSAVPREGATPPGPRAPAPSLPTIVVNQSQDALRTAYTQIQEEVDSGRRTAAWGENRRKEVFEAAQLTVQEAQLVEQSRQANQTTAFNVAHAQMNYGQSSLTNALKFTMDVNDKLKPGSGTGGKMFAALFNMQMAMGIASGMYSMGVPRGSSVGGPGAPGVPGSPTAAPGAPAQPPPPRLTNVGDPAAVEADHQASLAKLAAGDAADAAAGPGGRAMTPAIGGPPQLLPLRDGVPVTSTPALGPGHPENMSTFPWFTPTGPQGGVAVPPVALPQPAGSTPPLGQGQDLSSMPGTPPVGMPDIGRPAPPLSGQDDPRLDRRPGVPGVPLTGPDDPRIVRESFPAVEGLRQQYAPQPAPAPIVPNGGMDPLSGGIPPALARAQIAATPPWRLNPAELDSLVQQHGEDVVFGWPGQSLLGVG
jgi:hypothetical protein